MSSFLGAGAPVIGVRDAGGPATDMLIRNRELGRALALACGDRPLILMWGHRTTIAGAPVRQAEFRVISLDSVYRLT